MCTCLPFGSILLYNQMKDQEEVYVDIFDYEGLYQATSFGRIKSIRNKNPKLLSPYENVAGVYVVHFIKDGVQKIFQVKKLIAIAFLDAGVSGRKFSVRNIDGCEWNNAPENLGVRLK